MRGPKLWTKDISCIDYAKLHSLGIRGIIFDKDNTITTPYGLFLHDSIVSSLKASINIFGNHAVVLSNSIGRVDKKGEMEAAAQFEAQNGIRVLHPKRRKPLDLEVVNGFIKECGCKNEEVCVIGDRLLTDMVLGNLCGCTTILVNPLVTNPNNRLINRIVGLEHWLTSKLPKGKGINIESAISLNYFDSM